METLNGVTCIKGEIHSLLTLMRLHTRWANNNRYSRDTVDQEENHLVQSFRRLNDYLEDTYDLREVDCVNYLEPFHNVIISDQASGPLTSAALSSLSKFVLYGFLSADFPRACEGINLIAISISCCVFEETDWESDEIILMKLLELSTMCLRCDASSLLTVGAAWEIYSTCLSIRAQYRASKILRSQAETALRHLTLTAFGRADQVLMKHGAMPTITLGADLDFGFTDSVRGVSRQLASEMHKISGAVGITLLLGKIMTVLSSLMNPQEQKSETVKNALTLINIGLEAGGPSLGLMIPLVEVLRSDICRHLLRSSQSDDLEIFSLALRVVFNLFMTIKDHMKVQLEVFLSSVHLRLLQGASSTPTSSNTNTSPSVSAREELAMESLLEFCREPALMHDLYTNYDCDVQCTNLFDAIITTLCTRAIPRGVLPITSPATSTSTFSSNNNNDMSSFVSTHTPAISSTVTTSHTTTRAMSQQVTILNRLALDGALAVLRAVSSRCSSHRPLSTFPHDDVNESSNNNNNNNNSSRDPSINPKDTSHINSSSMNYTSDYTGPWIPASPLMPINQMIEQQVDRWCGLDPIPLTSSSVKDTFTLPNHNSNDNNVVEYPNNISSPAPSSIKHSSLSTVNLDDDRSVLSTSTTMTSISRATSSSLDTDPWEIETEEGGDTEFVHLARARTAEVLRQRKIRKRNLRLAAEQFNAHPLSGVWIRRAAELGLLPKPPSNAVEGKGGAGLVEPRYVARFLKNTPGLNKTHIGEYLSKGPAELYPFHASVLKEYVDTFDFVGQSAQFDSALRLFLGYFRLPGEAQCIDRLMEAFAKRLFSHLGAGKPFASSDAAFILAFSTIMLNTDLHNPQIPDNKRMKKEEFVRNNRGINDGADLPREYLEGLYDRIQTRQIQVDSDLSDTNLQTSQDYWTDTAAWDALLRRGAAGQAPASFTPTAAARRGVILSISDAPPHLADGLLASNERDMFSAMASPLLSVLLGVYWDISDIDDSLLGKLLTGIEDFAAACYYLELYSLLDRMIEVLVDKAIHLCSCSTSSSTAGSSLSQSSNLKVHKTASRGGIPSERYTSAVSLLETSDWDSLFRRRTASTATSYESPEISRKIDHHHTTAGSSAQATGGGGGVLTTSDKWCGASDVRGELLVRSLLQMLWKFVNIIGRNGWMSVIRLLVWSADVGALPLALSDIDNFSDARGGHLPASVYEQECRRKRSGSKDDRGGGQQDSGERSIWLSVASLGGLLWSTSEGGVAAAAAAAMGSNSMNNSQEPTSLLRKSLEAGRAAQLLFGKLRILSDTSLVRVVQSLLSVIRGKGKVRQGKTSTGSGGSSSGVQRELFVSCEGDEEEDNSDDEDETNADTIDTDDDSSSVLSDLTTVTTATNNNKPPRHPNTNPIPSKSHSNIKPPFSSPPSSSGLLRVSELSAVIVLEWISRIVFANRKRAKFLWPRVHEFLYDIILYHTTTIKSTNTTSIGGSNSHSHYESTTATTTSKPRYSYLLERSLVTILRAVMTLSDPLPNTDNPQQLLLQPRSTYVTSVIPTNTATTVTYTTTSSNSNSTELKASQLNAMNSASIPSTTTTCSSAVTSSSISPRIIDISRLPYTTTAITGIENIHTVTVTTAGIGSDVIWQSLSWLLLIDVNVLITLADRLAAGLLALLRTSISIITTELHWQEVFQLLTIFTGSETGRPFVWEAIGYLIETNLINGYNYFFCRKLVLAFLYRDFSGDITIESFPSDSTSPTNTASNSKQGTGIKDTLKSDSNSEKFDVTSPNPWLNYALLNLMRLGLMILAGYHKKKVEVEDDMGAGGIRNSVLLGPARSADENLAVFHLPPPSVSVVSSSSSTNTTSTASTTPEASMSGSGVGSSTGSGQHVIVVCCVHLPNLGDVEHQWLDTIRIACDHSVPDPAFDSRYAIFCLRAILLAGSYVSLTPHCWSMAVHILLVRLPLNASPSHSSSAHSLTSTLAASTSRAASSTDQTQYTQICSRNCKIVFETFVAHFHLLRCLSDFQTNWLRYITMLANNANTAPRGSPLHDELLEMLAALMKLLQGQLLPQLPFPSTIDSTTVSPEVGNDVMLRLSWRALASVYPALPALLKTRFPYLNNIANVNSSSNIIATNTTKSNVTSSSTHQSDTMSLQQHTNTTTNDRKSGVSSATTTTTTSTTSSHINNTNTSSHTPVRKIDPRSYIV